MSCICLCKDTNFKGIPVIERCINGCICLCKDTNFKANHNDYSNQIAAHYVVYAYAKILILKQITTTFDFSILSTKLYMPMQRY